MAKSRRRLLERSWGGFDGQECIVDLSGRWQALPSRFVPVAGQGVLPLRGGRTDLPSHCAPFKPHARGTRSTPELHPLDARTGATEVTLRPAGRRHNFALQDLEQAKGYGQVVLRAHLQRLDDLAGGGHCRACLGAVV